MGKVAKEQLWVEKMAMADDAMARRGNVPE